MLHLSDKDKRSLRIEQKRMARDREHGFGLQVSDICTTEHNACRSKVDKEITYHRERYGEEHPHAREMLQECEEQYGNCVSPSIFKKLYKAIKE